MDPFINRNTYRSLVSGDGLTYFRVSVKETDLLIGAARNLNGPALRAIQESRQMVEKEIMDRPEFQTSLVPIEETGSEPAPVLSMFNAGHIAGTGPMAAVAGMIAEYTGRTLSRYQTEVIVENGGDIFLLGSTPRTVAIAAGKSPLSMKLGIQVDPTSGMGICTSSGTYGHSLSFGRSDAAVVVSKDCALADAVATMLGNKCSVPEDLAPSVEWAASLPGVDGALVILGDHLAAAGDIELVRID